MDFGAFVDIGLHDDGLVHLSRMSMKRISHPSEVVSVGDIIDVYVVEIDAERGKIGLSLLSPEDLQKREAQWQANRNRTHHGNNKQKKKPEHKAPEPKKQVSMEDATARLLERFGKKH